MTTKTQKRVPAEVRRFFGDTPFHQHKNTQQRKKGQPTLPFSFVSKYATAFRFKPS